jgi:hypothetical protein
MSDGLVDAKRDRGTIIIYYPRFMKKVSYLFRTRVLHTRQQNLITFTPPGHAFKGALGQECILGRTRTPEKNKVPISTELLAPPPSQTLENENPSIPLFPSFFMCT